MFMEPTALLALCNLQTTDAVADFGAGSGFLSRAAAAIVRSGTVFAIDVNRDIVARLAREATEMNIRNLQALWGDIEIDGGSKLADSSVDFVILSNVMFHLDDKEGCLREAKRVLKSGGRALIVDWTDAFGGMGPRPQAVFSKDAAKALVQKLGFSILTDTMPAGDHHYAILLRKDA